MIRCINNAFLRADEIQWAKGCDAIDYFVPIIADAEAGFGGVLNAFELMKAMIEVGVPGKQAKAIAEAQKQAFVQALDTSLATKADVLSVKSELRTDLVALKSEFRSDLMAVQGELQGKISTVESDLMHTEQVKVNSDLHSEFRLIKWMLALVLLVSDIRALKILFA